MRSRTARIVVLSGVVLASGLVCSSPTCSPWMTVSPPGRAGPVFASPKPAASVLTPIPAPVAAPALLLPLLPLPGTKGREVVVGSGGLLGQWLVLGPLLACPTPAQLRSVRPGAPLIIGTGRMQRTVRWRILQSRRTRLNLRTRFRLRKKQHPRSGLLGLVLRTNRAQTVYLHLGHDDGLGVWLNGRQRLKITGAQTYEADHRLVPLRLRKGKNHLVLVLAWSQGAWRLRARLTGADHRPLGTGGSRGTIRLELPVRRPVAGVRWRRRAGGALHALQLGLRRAVTAKGLRYRLRVSASAGLVLPVGGRSSATLIVRANGTGRPTRTNLDLRQVAHQGIEVALPSPSWKVRFVTVSVTGWGMRRFWLPRAARLCRQLDRADKHLAAVKPGTAAPRASLDSVAYHLRDLRRLLERGDNDWAYLRRRLGVVARWARVLRRGKDPFGRLRGRLVKAYRSTQDGSLQPYSLYVPAGYSRRPSARRAWPLYVMLHGITSTHRKGVNQMLGVWKPLKDRTPWWKFLRRPGPIKVHPQALIVAPQAFGPAMYWHMGEVDVYRVIEEVKRHYRVDPARVILVGHSMGGTGVLDVGLHRPHLFAGMVSIAGYPSRWIHSEISKGPLAPWERLQAQRYSPVFWAPSGRHLGLIAVHGTRDGPEKSRMIVQAYRKLGFGASLKIHPYGHDVYRLYLNRGQVYRATRRWRTPRAPRRVTFRTTRLRWNRAHWLRLDGRPRADRWSEVDGRLVGADRVQVTTKNVDQLSLLLDAPLLSKVALGAPLRVTLDGDRLAVPRRRVLTFHRRGRRWHAGPRKHPAGLHKRRLLEGPIEDLHYGPVLVVYGTKDPRQRAALQRVASRLRRFRWGTVRYPVKADTAVTAADRRRYSLLLVGGPHANHETARYGQQLPIGVSDKEIRVGRRRFRGPDVGVRFIVPNPHHPKRYLLVVAGTTARGVLRQHLLPWYLPDYVVYDHTIENKRGFRVLGPTRRYLAAGYFTNRWR
jgi:poly(3-hydroxybutyrate) depolymerase